MLEGLFKLFVLHIPMNQVLLQPDPLQLESLSFKLCPHIVIPFQIFALEQFQDAFIFGHRVV
ncbi:hypothetical protein D3C81_2335680 [compost metagenome]